MPILKPPAGLGAGERCWRERLASCGLVSRASANSLRFDGAVLCAGEVLPATAAALACSLARIAAALSSLGAAAGAGCADADADADAVAPLDPFEAADGYRHESALAAGDPHAACLAGVETRAAGPPPLPASSKGRGYWWR